MPTSTTKLTPHKYEAVFCIFLVMIAFLYRDNEHLVYPQILYLFVVLLTLNLTASYVLNRWGENSLISASFILANCATITAILNYSGKDDSNLWVLFLLPIYTVCMLLKGREVVWITLGVLSFNLAFHQVSLGTWQTETIFLVSLKSGIFIFAAVATWSVAHRDRIARGRLLSQKQDLIDMEQKLREQESHVVQLEKMADVGEFSSGVAHDINNPITVIIGTSKMVLEDGLLDTTLKHDLERILRSAELCRVISNNLLNFAKKQELQTTPGNVNYLVESVLDMYGNVLAQSAIRVKKRLGENLPLVALSESHLHRVLLNLISNAKGAMKKGGTLTLTTRLHTSQSSSGIPLVQIMIEDTGTGISPEAMEKLFKPFNTTKGPEGTGLGLYLSREIVSKHNGLLQVDNIPEGGARFTILLPATSAIQTIAA